MGKAGQFRMPALGASLAALTLAASGVIGGASTALQAVVARPMVSQVADYVQLTHSETPPTQAQCASAGRRCHTPGSTRSAYNLAPLYDQGFDGSGVTVAVVDSYGSDT